MTAIALKFAALPLLLLNLSTEASSAPVALQPSGKWTVSFDDARCVAGRPYGTSEDPLFLMLKKPPLGDVMQLAVTRQGSGDADQVEATVTIDDRPPLRTTMLAYGQKKAKVRVFLLNMSLEEFSPIRNAKTLAMRSLGLKEVFSLSQIEPVLKLMDDCAADLAKVWNVSDPATEQSVLPTRAKSIGSLASYISDEDYPDVAIRNGQDGTVRFALLIDELGKVADCTILKTSGVAALDGQSCAIMKERARFKPAVGADGKPAKDAMISQITWRVH